MLKIIKTADARKISRILLATFLFVGLLSLESRASETLNYIISQLST